ncbi:MAG: alpha/beta hydrolase [Propionibacteriaceae bacterium]|nr:alpha/beta hydrolase [Propionibacteriaceae bacterium]
MTQLASYLVPGLWVTDHTIKVPLEWGDESWGTINFFYREVTDPNRRGDDLPLLLFLPDGPGRPSPRPTPELAWLRQAVEHYRVILPDPRGTGRSSLIDGEDIARFDDPAEAAWYLGRFLADAVVRDLEHLRIKVLGGRRWTTLGDGYGGFLTLTYLSQHPAAFEGGLINGGVPGLPASASDVCRASFARVEHLSRQFYRRYPADQPITASIVERLSDGDVVLPNGDPLTVSRFQHSAGDLTATGSFERLHWRLDSAFARTSRLSDQFLYDVMNQTAGADIPLFSVLRELIYGSGANGPINWAADRELERHPEFAPDAKPLLFFGDQVFPWMFDDIYELRPFKPAVDVLMQQVTWPRLYDANQLAANEVPLECVVYWDGRSGDAPTQLETLQGIGNVNVWVTNEFGPDELQRGQVFTRLRQRLDERAWRL